MPKYLAFALVAAVGAVTVSGIYNVRYEGLACGFAVTAGLCVVAAAIAELKDIGGHKP
jgi:tetrahydromethanopterin S-methyltransferase subunit F